MSNEVSEGSWEEEELTSLERCRRLWDKFDNPDVPHRLLMECMSRDLMVYAVFHHPLPQEGEEGEEEDPFDDPLYFLNLDLYQDDSTRYAECISSLVALHNALLWQLENGEDEPLDFSQGFLSALRGQRRKRAREVVPDDFSPDPDVVACARKHYIAEGRFLEAQEIEHKHHRKRANRAWEAFHKGKAEWDRELLGPTLEEVEKKRNEAAAAFPIYSGWCFADPQ